MTLAFARRIPGMGIGVYADRRITSEDGSYNDNFDKIIEGADYAIAFAGNPFVGGIIMSLEEKHNDLYEFARLVKEASKDISDDVDYEMIVVADNNMYRIDSNCVIQEYEDSIVIGSGEQYATYLVETDVAPSAIYAYVSSKINNVSPEFVTVVI